MTVAPAPSTSVGPTSAPDPGAAARGDCSQMPDLHSEMDALDPPLANREIHANTMATLDLSPQSPPLPSVTDLEVAIAGRSLREPSVEHIEDNRLDPSHSQYDMV